MTDQFLPAERSEPVAPRWVFRAGMIDGPILEVMPLDAQAIALEERCRSFDRLPRAQSRHCYDGHPLPGSRQALRE